MIFGNLFKKKPEPDKPKDRTVLRLDQLVPGDLLTHDQKVFEIVALAYFRWEDTKQELAEWTLSSSEERRLLRHFPEHAPPYHLLVPLDLTNLDAGLAEHIVEQDDPPAKLSVGNTAYEMVASECGLHRAHKGAKNREFLHWLYEAPGTERILVIEQWGERDFRAYEGRKTSAEDFSALTIGRRLSA